MIIDVRHGDCADVLETLPDSSVDSVVTSPPYAMQRARAHEWIDADEVAAIAENISAASHDFPSEWQGKLRTWAKRLRASLPKPRTMADTEWDDNFHPYMEATTVSGRRHILLAPMGDTEVSENTILVAEHDGGMPVLVPAEHLFPTGRYARLSMPEDHPTHEGDRA